MTHNEETTAGAPTADTRAELPMFYKTIVPLVSVIHEDLAFEAPGDLSFASNSDAIVLTAEEFVVAQMSYPIIFSTGDMPMPVAMTGAPGRGNQFVDQQGQWQEGIYIPAYVRRYPFILAKLAPHAKDLSLCFDEACEQIAAGEDGKLFSDGEPSDTTKAVLQFCEGYEAALQKTRQFVQDLIELDLLIDARAEIQAHGSDPILFHGFQMVSEEKLRGLNGNQYRKLAKSGALGLIYAHLFSLRHIGKLFRHDPSGQDVHNARERAIEQ